ncbi:basic amino acid/polyamine antiporter [Timonella senegalensis]|uniref:basic amino acid/polyamine antiporter n=1 Tax=Timonella senegalensis TaxID=1465825 RepID=UPI0009D9314D|nr:basic amino acid/polyamine antiporter [Timonella senegalensis]
MNAQISGNSTGGAAVDVGGNSGPGGSGGDSGTSAVKKVSLATLTAMVVGSMVGAGVFSLPSNFGQSTGVFGAIIAWLVAGSGMLTIALVFQWLASRRPDLDSGVYAYAKSGFGELPGFISAFGYWVSACIGNVTYWVLIMSTIGAVAPGLGSGDTLLAVGLSVIGVWIFHFLVARGIREATIINRIVTVAKVVPIVMFVIVTAVLMDTDVFAANFWGDGYGSLPTQISKTMMVTLFVFLGVEGASVYSRYARKRSDVGKATIGGFLGVLTLFSLVALVSYGTMTQNALAELRQPSMAGVFAEVVGPWGGTFVSMGLIISVLGAYLAWTLMAAEVMFTAARDNDMPRFLNKLNKNHTPINALIMSSTTSMLFLFVTILSEDAFEFSLTMTGVMSLVPYLLASAFAVKVAWGDIRGTAQLTKLPEGDAAILGTRKQLIMSALAVVYSIILIAVAGLDILLVSCVIYALGTTMFIMTRREQNRRVFSKTEGIGFAVLVIAGVLGIVFLATGTIAL